MTLDEWQVGNPFPGISTETNGMNDPGQGIPLDEWSQEMLEGVRPARREPVSKHRAGRHKKLDPKKQKSIRARSLRENIRKTLDEKALREAVNA